METVELVYEQLEEIALSPYNITPEENTSEAGQALTDNSAEIVEESPEDTVNDERSLELKPPSPDNEQYANDIVATAPINATSSSYSPTRLTLSITGTADVSRTFLAALSEALKATQWTVILSDTPVEESTDSAINILGEQTGAALLASLTIDVEDQGQRGNQLTLESTVYHTDTHDAFLEHSGAQRFSRTSSNILAKNATVNLARTFASDFVKALAVNHKDTFELTSGYFVFYLNPDYASNVRSLVERDVFGIVSLGKIEQLEASEEYADRVGRFITIPVQTWRDFCEVATEVTLIEHRQIKALEQSTAKDGCNEAKNVAYFHVLK